MDSLTFFDLILFLGVSQGIFLAVTILIIQNNNKSANKLLAILLLIAALMLTGRVCVFRYRNPTLLRFAEFADVCIFIFGPVLYAYVKRLTFSYDKVFRLSVYHFIPALLHLCYFIWTLFFSFEELIHMYKDGFFTPIYTLTGGLGVLSNIIYLLASYFVVKRFKKEEFNNLSYNQSIHLYLNTLIFGISIFLFFWLTSYINIFLGFNYYLPFNYALVWITIPVFIYIIGFFSLKQPEIFRMPVFKKQTLKKERLDGDKLTNIKKKLEHLMITEKIYLDNKLTLQKLAEKLTTSPNNISWLLNNIHNCNFYDYVNKYRVDTFIEKVQNGEHKYHTILALSLDSGFNSKSTFNKVFKSIMNQTPSNYIKNLQPLNN